MNRISTIVLFFISTLSHGQFFKKKQQIKDPNLVQVAENYDASKDINTNPRLKYLIQNLIPGSDTAKVSGFMLSSNISYDFITANRDPILLTVLNRGSTQMLECFLKHGANPNLRSIYIEYGPVHMSDGHQDNETFYSEWPLSVALGIKDTSKMSLLKKYGVQIEPLRTQLQALVTERPYTHFITNFLGSNQVAPDALWWYIHLASPTSAKIQDVRDLIDRGSDVNNVEHAGYTPLLEALSNHLPFHIIFALVMKGANPSIGIPKGSSTRGITPLHYAACNGDLETVKLLIEHGADPNTQCESCGIGSGNTPLQHAINSGFNNVVDYLFSKGAK